MTEITQAGIEDYLLELAPSEGNQEPAVTKFNITLFPKVSTGPDSNRRGISLRGREEMVSEVVELEGEERKEMSYIMLSWLTGTSQDLNHLAVAKGRVTVCTYVRRCVYLCTFLLVKSCIKGR